MVDRLPTVHGQFPSCPQDPDMNLFYKLKSALGLISGTSHQLQHQQKPQQQQQQQQQEQSAASPSSPSSSSSSSQRKRKAEEAHDEFKLSDEVQHPAKRTRRNSFDSSSQRQ